MDPVLVWIARLGLSVLFAIAGAHKLRDLPAFSRTVRGYAVLPARSVSLVGPALVAVELSIAVALLVPGGSRGAAAVAAVLLASYTAAIAVNLVRGRRDIECGCLGPGHRQPLSEGLLARNAALLVAALLAGQVPLARALGWVDALSIVGGSCTAALLFAAASQLEGQWATLQRLGRST